MSAATENGEVEHAEDTRLGVDDKTVRSVVKALGHRGEMNPDLRVERVGRSPLAGATGGTWRVSGTVLEPTGPTAWSAVVKRIERPLVDRGRSPEWPATRSRRHPMYWRREAEFYASPLASSTTGPLRVPTCLATRSLSSRSAEIWMTDLHDVRHGSTWTVEDYGATARHVGQFQSRYLSTGDLAIPDDPWLSRGWLRWYVRRRPRTPPRPSDDRALQNAHVRTLLAVEDVRPAFAAMWADRFRLLDALDALPRTVVHHDYWPPNLFLGPDSASTYAIDWAYVGVGAICEDVANLVPDSLMDGYIEAEKGDELDDAVFSGYVDGLREGGCELSTDLIRFAYAAAACVKYTWMLRYMVDLAFDQLPRKTPRSPEELDELFRTRAIVLPQIARYHREALSLADRIGL